MGRRSWSGKVEVRSGRIGEVEEAGGRQLAEGRKSAIGIAQMGGGARRA